MRRRAALLLAALALLAARRAGAQVSLTGFAVLHAVEHRVDGGFGLESTSGTAFGAGALLAIGPHVELRASAVSGTLAANTPAAASQTFARVDVRADVLPAPWLALGGGVTRHGFESAAARQRWTTARIGAELRLPFVSGALTGRLRAELLPKVSVSGITDPQSAFAVASALTWSGGPFTAEVAYGLERYDFPVAGGFQRHEQLSTLTVGLGLRVGSAPGP